MDEQIFLAAAFTCGLEKVVVPFFDYGIPVEYELIRSICTVAKKERKTVGIVRTDAQLFGGFTFAGGRPQDIPKQEIVRELEKQYDVKEIDPTNPIEKDTFDVMLVVQPSSLSPEQLDNVLEAIKERPAHGGVRGPASDFHGRARHGRAQDAAGRRDVPAAGAAAQGRHARRCGTCWAWR
jgi:hypothetical protein